jgi:hypothetical protein
MRMTAQIIPFRDYQNPRDVGPMNGDIETRLAELNHMAAEVFKGLTIDMATAEYSDPDKNLLLFSQALCEELPTRDVCRHATRRAARRRPRYSAPMKASTITIANPATRIITSFVMLCFADSVMAKILH